ncbi:hypothetical protein VB735_30490 [Halotia wernerae UHCC 0503]|nr:hypothetical protein [Halotia wernerae UHCC 0503]
MKRNQLIGVLVGAIVLSTVGTASIATAQIRSTRTPNIIGNLAVRVCNPNSFDAILRTDFRGIRLNQRQNDTIQQAYQDYLNWVLDDPRPTPCFENGTIKNAWLLEYGRYETTVRRTLDQRQLRQWDRNVVQAILRSRG